MTGAKVGGGAWRWLAGSALLLLVAPMVSSPAAAQQNLVSNPGFEIVSSPSGPLFCQAASWTSSGSCTNNYFYGFNAPHSGTSGLAIGQPAAGPASISQTINGLTAGPYDFSFFYRIFLRTAGGTFTASVGGQTFSFGTTAPATFTQVSEKVVLAGGSTTIAFGNGTGVANWGADVDDVSLTLLSLTAQLPAGAPQNPTNVTLAINGFLNNGGTLPTGFANLFNLSAADLQVAASQLSGEAATGAQQSSYQLVNDFLLLMTEPSTLGNGTGGFAAAPFAAEQTRSLPPDVAMAYASMLKAPPAPAVAGWNVWGSAYGGAGHINGDAAVIGSHDLSTSAGGFAAGADRLVTPDTRLGFALAGGFEGWGLSDGLGGGRGDAFQAGVYGRTTQGPVYLAGALAFTEHWMTTDRFVLGDHLTANFAAESVSARLEGGYRLPASYTPYIGVIPYAAIQAQHFHAPGFSETDLTGGGLGLTFNSQNSTDTRAELGSRFDKLILLDQGAVLALRARLAWAHDWVTNPALTAIFQALPAASFVVNGAAPKHDSALVSFGPEVTWRSGWSLMAKFDGEFANGEQLYAGTARLRYAW